MNLEPINISATTLSDAWFQTLYKCIELGKNFIIDRGSYTGDQRLEFDYITIHIKHPDKGDLLPTISERYNIPDPVELEYIFGGTDKNGVTYERSYVEYLMTSTKMENESYTYGERLTKQPVFLNMRTDKEIYIQDQEILNDKNIFIYDEKYKVWYLNQIEFIIKTYKKFGHRNNQMVLQVARPEDCTLLDPPCLRQIDTRIQDDTLHFFPEFRSWDLWGGFPANLAAIETLKQYMAAEIGVKNGGIIARSKGLHIYKYVWELSEILRNKTIEDFRNGKKENGRKTNNSN